MNILLLTGRFSAKRPLFRYHSFWSVQLDPSRCTFFLPGPASISCPEKANTDIVAWLCRCFSDVFTYVKMRGGGEPLRDQSPQLRELLLRSSKRGVIFVPTNRLCRKAAINSERSFFENECYRKCLNEKQLTNTVFSAIIGISYETTMPFLLRDRDEAVICRISFEKRLSFHGKDRRAFPVLYLGYVRHVSSIRPCGRRPARPMSCMI